MTALQSFPKTRQLLYAAVSRTRPSSPTPRQQKSHHWALRKLEQAKQVRMSLHTLKEKEGSQCGQTDGRRERRWGGPRWGGMECIFH